LKDGDELSYIVKIDEFEGPFELLLELIKKREMDIFDLQISQITSDYLLTLEQMKEQNIDITSDFMEMAGMLLQIKAKLLIPVEVEKEDPRAELVQQILDYQEYKEAVQKMEELKILEQKFFKSEKAIKIKKKKKGTIQDIINSYHNILKKKLVVSDKKNNPLGRLTEELTKFKYTIEEQMDFIKDELEKGKIHIETFFYSLDDKELMVTTFGAMLELVKIQYIAIFINDYEEVYIEKRSK
jgi:segregation and condensation protein A